MRQPDRSQTPTGADIEKRREVRYPCSDPAELRVAKGDGTVFPAKLLDISRTGLRLELGVSLQVHAEVVITLHKQAVLFGTVRHCREVNGGFSAGIQISDVVYADTLENGHVRRDLLERYLAGKGLVTSEVLSVREHLRHCRSCRAHLTDDRNAL